MALATLLHTPNCSALTLLHTAHLPNNSRNGLLAIVIKNAQPLPDIWILADQS
jgi:hypothetical protein